MLIRPKLTFNQHIEVKLGVWVFLPNFKKIGDGDVKSCVELTWNNHFHIPPSAPQLV